MAITGAMESLKFKLLLGTLKDVALCWYMNLHWYYITGYTDFAQKMVH